MLVKREMANYHTSTGNMLVKRKMINYDTSIGNDTIHTLNF